MRLTMVGTGYVGLVTGVCLANTGNDVVCLDLDPAKIAMLRSGKSPIYEAGLEDLLEHNIKAGRLSFTTDTFAAHADAEMIFICVGTPSDKNGHTDLSYIDAAADGIGETLAKLGPTAAAKVIVVKSTVPVGTTFRVRDRIAAKVGPAITFHVADNPEFLKEGAAIEDFNKPDRVVCGVENEHTAVLMRELYEPFVRNGHPIYIMDVPSAEMVKYASNAMLACKISFINEMANLCEAYGADVGKVREGMCADRRIGNQFLYPGLGYGGSCFPKDTLACIMMGEQRGIPTPVNRAVHQLNQDQRKRFFGKIESYFGSSRGSLAGRTLAFWGIAFKPRTDDIREAPAIALMQMAKAAGAHVRAFDPVAGENARKELGPGYAIVEDMYEAAKGADALVVCTDWDEFKSPNWQRLTSVMAGRVVFDGRNLYRPQAMREHGLSHISVGRESVLLN